MLLCAIPFPKKNTASETASITSSETTNNRLTIPEERFAEFAESVEVGLADYFLGPLSTLFYRHEVSMKNLT